MSKMGRCTDGNGGSGNFWECRNNSTNTSRLLNSDLYWYCNGAESIVPSIRKPTFVSNHCSYPLRRNKKKAKPIIFSCDECYCKKSPVKPKLKVKLSDQGCEVPCDIKWAMLRQMCRKSTPNSNIRSSRSPALCQRGCSSSSTLLKGVQCCEWCPRCIACMKQCCCCSPQVNHKSNKHYAPCRQYTTPRAKCGENRTLEEVREKYARTFPDSEGNAKSEEDDYPDFDSRKAQGSCDSKSLSNQMSSSSLNKARETGKNLNDLTFFKSTTDVRENLRRLSTFRKENYFDCFSADICADVDGADHKCIHKFYLDNRLIPQPLNADPFGLSRCVICNKAMQSEETVGKRDSRAVAEHKSSSLTLLRNLRDLSKSKIPNQINITSKNDRMEIKIPLDFNKYSDLLAPSGNFSIKNRVPVSSLALRHQKRLL